MNTLERETNPAKLAAMIAKSERESLLWQEEDRQWNKFLAGKAPIHIENLELKCQVKILKETSSMSDELKKMIIETHTVLTKKALPIGKTIKKSKEQLRKEKIEAIRLQRMLD